MYRRLAIIASFLVIFWTLVACSRAPSGENVEASPAAPSAENAEASPERSVFASKQTTLPAGTIVTVRLGQSVGSKISSSGDHFSATVAKPVQVGGKTVVPAGVEASGRIVEAVPQGRFKGAAVLRLVLESVTVNGEVRDVKTSSVSRSLKGKGKRTATLIGGGAGAGALIGGLAGGGKGALIGAAAGAGGGSAGAGYTRHKKIGLPAESILSFTHNRPNTIKM